MLRRLALLTLAAFALPLAACAADGGDPAPADVAPDALADVPDLPDAAPDAPDGEPPDEGPDAADAPDDAPDAEAGFDDHTVASFASKAGFLAFADTGATPVQAKFCLLGFSDADPGPTVFLDPAFYALHDEWYWFRLLNGEPVPGLDVAPVEGPAYPTVASVYAALAGTADLPLDLVFTADGRLYSKAFYDLAVFTEPRFFGIGSVLWLPEDPARAAPEELWLFELEYVDDDLTAEQVARFFARLEAALPAEVGGRLRWLLRSPGQEVAAAALKAAGDPLGDRVLTYADLVVDGAVEAYNPGITAGYVRRVAKGQLGGGTVGPSDVVVLEAVPDELPPVAGIVTAVPQTPLAHLNLLAQSRGTPNAYVAGAYDDPGVVDWATWNRLVVLKVGDGGVQWKPITAEQYQGWLALKGKASFTIPPVDLSSAPYFLDLTAGGLADVAGRVPLVGGKCAGFLAFNDLPAVEAPDGPVAITLRAYHEHLAPLRATLETLLADTTFRASSRARFLLLEGRDAFEEAHAGDAPALAWLATFDAEHPPGTFLGDLAGPGVKVLLRAQPLDPAFAANLQAALADRFAFLSPLQGLRFRSSSTAEDVEGFNGAGLYDSNTGFLDPLAQADPDDWKRSLAWALRKTWASYWSFGAFEERRAAGIDHLSGNMGVLVHPRFDDALEDANGVVTLWLAREAAGDRASLVVNAQDGALSVTNPDPTSGDLPEVDRVSQLGDAPPTVERLQASTAVGPGEVVLSDAELLQLFGWIAPLADLWLDQANVYLPPSQRRSTLVLDLEWKRMAAGWPALASGEVRPARLVLKQVRTLQSPITAPASVKAMPIPRDILEEVARIERRTCEAPGLQLVADETYTDPARDWALPYEDRPFVSRVTLTFPDGVPALGLAAGTAMTLLHTSADTLDHPAMGEVPWDLRIVLAEGTAAQAGFSQLLAAEGGPWSVSDGAASAGGGPVTCSVTPILQSASDYLEGLLAP